MIEKNWQELIKPNKIELKDIAKKVIAQNQTELMKLKKNYANYYNDEKNAIDQVLQVIIK